MARPSPEATVVGVYRRRNAAHVLKLLEPALERGWRTAWWALDDVDPGLAEHTIGKGAGEKFPLVNETLRRSSLESWIVVADDDVRFRRSDIVGFLETCSRAGFDLSQPARARRTPTSHEVTVARRFVRARLTTFVECGPLFAIGPRWREQLLPLRNELGMGWGAELEWFDLVDSGCRLGIVDAARVEHLGTVGEDYETGQLHERLRSELAARGASDLGPFQRTLAVWHPWQLRPAWLDGRPE